MTPHSMTPNSATFYSQEVLDELKRKAALCDKLLELRYSGADLDGEKVPIIKDPGPNGIQMIHNQPGTRIHLEVGLTSCYVSGKLGDLIHFMPDIPYDLLPKPRDKDRDDLIATLNEPLTPRPGDQEMTNVVLPERDLQIGHGGASTLERIKQSSFLENAVAGLIIGIVIGLIFFTNFWKN